MGTGLSDPFEINLGNQIRPPTNYGVDGLTNGTFEEGPTLPPSNPPFNSFGFIPDRLKCVDGKPRLRIMIIELWGDSGHVGVVPASQGSNLRRTGCEHARDALSGRDHDPLGIRGLLLPASGSQSASDSMQFKIEELVGGPGSAVASVRFSRDMSYRPNLDEVRGRSGHHGDGRKSVPLFLCLSLCRITAPCWQLSWMMQSLGSGWCREFRRRFFRPTPFSGRLANR